MFDSKDKQLTDSETTCAAFMETMQFSIILPSVSTGSTHRFWD